MAIRSYLTESIERSFQGIPYGHDMVEVSRPNDCIGLSRTVEWETGQDYRHIIKRFSGPTKHTVDSLVVRQSDLDPERFHLVFDQEKTVYPTANPDISRVKQPKHYEGFSDEINLRRLGMLAWQLNSAVVLIGEAGYVPLPGTT